MDENILKWIADYSEGSIGEEDWLRLKRWVEEKPEHRVIFDDYLRVYRNAHEIGFMEKMDAERSWRALERKLRRGHRMMVVRWMVAASVVFGGAVGGWLLLAKNGARENVPVAEAIPGKAAVKLFMADGKSVTLSENQSLDLIEKDGTEIRKDTAKGLVYGAENVVEKSVLHTLDVPVGGEFELTLADGSRVWLNSMTKFRYPTHFTGTTREVFVEGEAFFSVKKDADRPFIVHTGGVRVKVLGTEFNLSAYPGEKTVTTLAAGKVEVAGESDKVSLQPGEQAIWNNDLKNIEVKAVDAALYSSWIKGVFEFENISLLAITRQLSRWYGVTFQFEDCSCAERCFTGGIKKYVPLIQSLEIIEKTTNVVFKITGKNIIVRSR
ncbi:FecR family protein [Butyricimonas synergistica]|uniref:FecR family protein n=1 Tax=Butyricimonas synergistica TaxID=544644 RepID=UPI0003612501|nr:FecR family protein [Butyricimonas synergistica]